MSSQFPHATFIALILLGCSWMCAVSAADVAYESTKEVGDEAGDDEDGNLLCEYIFMSGYRQLTGSRCASRGSPALFTKVFLAR